MGKLKVSVMAFFFPQRCTLCRKVIPCDTKVCKECEKRNISHNFRDYLHLKRMSLLVPYVSPFLYKGDVRIAIHRLKFRNNPDISEFFALKIFEAMKEHGMLDFDIITCVPMFKNKKYKRGFNQAQLIANHLAKLSGIKYEDTLLKIKDNKPQHSLARGERTLNVKGAYKCLAQEKIGSKKLLLIDDVITTGSTILECADTLYKAGAAAVQCASAAKA